MTIQPFVFDFIFYAVVFGAGLDLTISGYKVLKENTNALEKPKLLGLFIIKTMHISDTSQIQNRLTLMMFKLKNMARYTFLAGVLLLIASLIMILGILVRALS